MLGHSNMSRVTRFRGGSRAAATSKMESFVIIVNGWEPLTIITKNSILDVATVLDSPLRPFRLLANRRIKCGFVRRTNS